MGYRLISRGSIPLQKIYEFWHSLSCHAFFISFEGDTFSCLLSGGSRAWYLVVLLHCSGLTCRTLSEFGASGLHHPAEAVRKVSERILVLVYKVNPRLVRKQLPPDDDITRRNLLYRQLFHEFDKIDLQVRNDPARRTKEPELFLHV